MASDAFSEFVAARYGALARSAYLMTGDRELAEDLVQTALAATYRSWPRLKVAETAESYTRTTMMRLMGRWSRRRWRNEIPTAAPQPASGASAYSVDVAAFIDVRTMLAALPWTQRAVLVLRFFDDLSERETAAVLGCSEGTVKSRTSRALATLRARGALMDTESDDDRA